MLFMPMNSFLLRKVEPDNHDKERNYERASNSNRHPLANRHLFDASRSHAVLGCAVRGPLKQLGLARASSPTHMTWLNSTTCYDKSILRHWLHIKLALGRMRLIQSTFECEKPLENLLLLLRMAQYELR